jgi:peptidoglycan/LPS O-acetylase OafA/YrhL
VIWLERGSFFNPNTHKPANAGMPPIVTALGTAYGQPNKVYIVRMKHRRDIDGLRAVAVLSVLFYHFNLGGFSGGFAGVDIFFVISGFVISNSILSDTTNNTFSVSNFYFKRIRRIFPAYIAVILVATVVSYIILLPQDFGDYSKSLSASSAFVSNIYFWETSGYFVPSAHTKPLLHTWSLSVEEQFYIFVPLLVHFLHRFGRQGRALLLLPLLLSSFALSVIAVFVAPTAGFFLLPTRAWELFLGVFLALMKWPAPASPKAREFMAVLGAGLVLAGIFTLSSDDPIPGWSALWPCVGAALIIQAGSGLNTNIDPPWVNRLLSTGPVVWIGLISYSLYLIHWPIAAFARYELLRVPDAFESCLMIAASIGLAALSWRYIEQPFRRITHVRSHAVLAAGGGVALAGVLLGWFGTALNGMVARFPDFARLQIDGGEAWGGNRCFNLVQTKPIDWDAKSCTRVHGAHGRILVWGDSFAAQYMSGIMQNGDQINADVLQYTFAGCPPILDYFYFANVGCSLSNTRIPLIIREEKIDTVVLIARWTNVQRRHWEKLPKTLAELNKLGVRVYVFGQSPEFVMDVQLIDYISGARMNQGTHSWKVSFNNDVNENLKRLSDGASFVNPLSYLCDDLICPYRENYNYYYGDYGHFSAFGSAIAVAAYFPKGAQKISSPPKGADHAAQ